MNRPEVTLVKTRKDNRVSTSFLFVATAYMSSGARIHGHGNTRTVALNQVGRMVENYLAVRFPEAE